MASSGGGEGGGGGGAGTTSLPTVSDSLSTEPVVVTAEELAEYRKAKQEVRRSPFPCFAAALKDV